MPAFTSDKRTAPSAATANLFIANRPAMTDVLTEFIVDLLFRIKFARDLCSTQVSISICRANFSKSGEHSEGGEFLRGQESAANSQEAGCEARFPE